MLRKKKAHKNRHTLYIRAEHQRGFGQPSDVLLLSTLLGGLSWPGVVVCWAWDDYCGVVVDSDDCALAFASTQYPTIYHPSRLMLVPSGLLKRAKKWSRLVQFQQSVEQRCRGIVMHTKHICAYYWVDSWSDLQSIFHTSFHKWNSAND